MKIKLTFIVIIIFMFGQGCSVYMAANQPDKKDVSVFNTGTPRMHLIAEVGRPLYTDKKEDGTLTDTFVFVQGYSSDSKGGRAVFHTFADVLTAGLWEVIGTPIEAVADGTEVKVQVEYDANEKVQNIIALSGNEALEESLTRLTSPLFALGTIMSYVYQAHRLGEDQKHHDVLIDKICDGTVDEAIEAMRSHVFQNWKVTRESVEKLLATNET